MDLVLVLLNLLYLDRRAAGSPEVDDLTDLKIHQIAQLELRPGQSHIRGKLGATDKTAGLSFIIYSFHLLLPIPPTVSPWASPLRTVYLNV